MVIEIELGSNENPLINIYTGSFKLREDFDFLLFSCLLFYCYSSYG